MKRWQFSSKKGEDIILVDYTDENWEDFVLDVEKAKNEFNPQEKTEPKPVKVETPNKTIYSCETCGAEASLRSGTSKKGNFYKIMKCSKDETHDRFIR